MYLKTILMFPTSLILLVTARGQSQDDHNHKNLIGIELWCSAIGSTVLISVAPISFLILIPLDKGHAHEGLLKTLLSFASGCLLGDAFLHLIPHSKTPPNSSIEIYHHDLDHSYAGAHSHNMNDGLCILSGIVTFLIVEKLVTILNGGKPLEEKTTEQHGDVCSLNDECNKKKDPGIKTAAYLNLAADITHNFTDGLTIGASYLVSRNVGMITTLTILLHEVPHEIGDFAILIQSGCSKKKAMIFQVATAAGTVSGTVCCLLAGGAGGFSVGWILPFTAGGFVYIGTVSIIPELIEECTLWQSVKEILAMVAGVLIMVFIAEVE